MSSEFDYIIVGAGSAGCALAWRLSREASHRVLLLEAGGKDTNPMIHIPLGFTFMMKNPQLNWCYKTEPEPGMNNRQIEFPRGKVLGGSSSINGMLYMRGQKEDYDGWAALGNQGWAYDELLPYFKRSEHNTRGESHYHGTGGPLWVEDFDYRFELGDLFIQAGIDVGIPPNEDFNGATMEGMGYYQANIKKGFRFNTAKAFLKPARNRPNLVIQTHALTTQILFEGKRACGIRYTVNGKPFTAKARGEIILCGGSINSPQLLELSGIGNREILEPLGIKVVEHLPGVGENLQDHLTINLTYALRGVRTFYEEARPLAFVGNLVRYLVKHNGLLAHPASQVGAFFRTSPDVSRPDAQIHFAPAAGEYNDKGNMVPVPGTTATVCHLRPESRGSVHIRSADALVYPMIRANYLATAEDRKRAVLAVKRTREIFASKIFDPYRVGEMEPGPNVTSDEQLLEFIRNTGNSVYHPVGTCKMGHDENAVVDDCLRVHGIEGLRIADGSIMPTILSANTHATCVAIADKCADMILADARQRDEANSITRRASVAGNTAH